MFLTPGTPKDALTYIVPLTPIKPFLFFIMATIGRIPSILTSTYLGSSLIHNNIWHSIAIFGFSAILGIIGIIIYNKFNKKIKQ
jgi:uncharacterized membrane protein YdjX (TVP38/TMEM64 family)